MKYRKLFHLSIIISILVAVASIHSNTATSGSSEGQWGKVVNFVAKAIAAAAAANKHPTPAAKPAPPSILHSFPPVVNAPAPIVNALAPAPAKPSLMNSLSNAEKKKTEELNHVLNNVKKIEETNLTVSSGNNNKKPINIKKETPIEQPKRVEEQKNLVKATSKEEPPAKSAQEVSKEKVASAMLCLLDQCPKDDKNKLSIFANNKATTPKPANKKSEIIQTPTSPPQKEIKKSEPQKEIKKNEPQKESNKNEPQKEIKKSEPQKEIQKNESQKEIKKNEHQKKIEHTKEIVEAVQSDKIVFDKLELQKLIDQRYIIRRLQDSMINEDNTLRIVVSDTVDMETYSMKFYMKGDQKQKAFYEFKDKYTNGQSDCDNNKIIVNRLYGLPPTSTQEITDKIKPILPHIQFPLCKSKNTQSNLNGNFVNIFTVAEGRRLDKKCLKYLRLTKHNSCIPFIKTIAKGLLNAVHIMNMGKVFFRHGNIYPHNIYLLSQPKEHTLYLDNMLVDAKKYDNIATKPFKDDFDMIGNTLINLITGTNQDILVDPKTKEPIHVTGAFEIFHAIKEYFESHKLDINIFAYDLNIVGDIFTQGKALTKAEIEYKLRDTVFNFIYRLKCVGVHPSNQFIEISQAMQHKFIAGLDADVEQWDSLASDI